MANISLQEHAKSARVPVPNWGPRIETQNGLAAVNRRGPSQLAHLLSGHLILCNFTPYMGRETRLAGSRIRYANANPGSCEIVPAQADYWARWHQHKQVVTFVVESTYLERLALQAFDRTNVEIEVDGLPFVSERIRQLANMLRSDVLQMHQTSLDLYTDSLLTLLGMELLKNHSSISVRSVHQREYIPRNMMAKVIEYMRSEIRTSITLDSLAGVTGYSPDHFLKCFRAETGQTPHRFLVNLRLDLAQDLLRSTRITITEIASRTGFSSQAHLTSTMRRVRSVTPGQLRRRVPAERT